MGDRVVSIKKFMSEDHDRLDGIFREFQNAKKSDPGRAIKLFSEFKTGLQRHIVWEEEILFPLFEQQNDMGAPGAAESGPTAVMRTEHRQIKEFLEKIHDGIAAGGGGTDDFERALLDVLRGHNDKEEGILYPWIDESVSGENREKAFKEMHELPPEKYNRCCG